MLDKNEDSIRRTAERFIKAKGSDPNLENYTIEIGTKEETPHLYSVNIWHKDTWVLHLDPAPWFKIVKQLTRKAQ